jgi:hypothetical protein
MSMTKRLWSISALAAELGRDRRTVAAALRDVAADGTLRDGHRGWHLQTALDALDEGRSSRPAQHEPRETLLSRWAGRLDAWPELFAEIQTMPVMSFEETCADARVDAETLLTWVRCGLPYVDQGDIVTGQGFSFRAVHIFDWLCAMILVPGSVAERQRMKIEDYGRRR